MDPAATQFYINLNAGQLVTMTRGVSFSTAPRTGYYLQVNPLNDGTPTPGVLNVATPVTPATPSGRYLRTTSAIQLPDLFWGGVTQP